IREVMDSFMQSEPGRTMQTQVFKGRSDTERALRFIMASVPRVKKAISSNPHEATWVPQYFEKAFAEAIQTLDKEAEPTLRAYLTEGVEHRRPFQNYMLVIELPGQGKRLILISRKNQTLYKSWLESPDGKDVRIMFASEKSHPKDQEIHWEKVPN